MDDVSSGAFQLDPHTGAILNEERITDDDLNTVIRLCEKHRVPPIVYNGAPTAERATWVEGEESEGMRRFLADRVGDRRFRAATAWAHLPGPASFHSTIIAEASAIAALTIDIAAATDGRLSLIAQTDAHHPQDTYLELSAARAIKAHAVAWLREYLGVDQVMPTATTSTSCPCSKQLTGRTRSPTPPLKSALPQRGHRRQHRGWRPSSPLGCLVAHCARWASPLVQRESRLASQAASVSSSASSR